jgi:hypothetical protein
LRICPESVAGAPPPAPGDSLGERVEGAFVRQLHVDELIESLRLAGEAWEALAAILRGSTVRKAGRLVLAEYRAVQEASYWALPLAPGFDLWGVDRQLRRADLRQRVFFAQRRAEAQPPRILLVAPDPALAYGEPNEPGMQLLDACHLSLDTNRILYLTCASVWRRLPGSLSLGVTRPANRATWTPPRAANVARTLRGPLCARDSTGHRRRPCRVRLR